MSVTRWIGEYEVVRRLRVGGMATLYLARRHGAAGFSRLAAIKVIHPHLVEQPQFVEMFVDEARICSQISHPNVVHVEELGEVDGTHYIVMEYIDGCSANDLLAARDERFSATVAAHIIMYTARGLHAAHETQGADGALLDVIHRDISPSNILISTSGHIKLIDFGIAKANNRITETETGFAMKGKYRYVAPEQAKRTDLDRRSDIFSLGVVFWELLTGKPLFSDDTQVALFNRLEQTTVEPPSTVNPNVPPALDPIVLGMLQHDPSQRPQTALEVYRQIAVAMPDAFAYDSTELGALVTAARDKRKAKSGDEAVDANPSFSATPQPRRTTSMSIPIPVIEPAPVEEYRVEVTPSVEEPRLPPAPPPSRRGLYAAIGVAMIATIVAIVFAFRSSNDATTTTQPGPAPIATQPAPEPVMTQPAPARVPVVQPAPSPEPVATQTPEPVTEPAPVVTPPAPVVAPPTVATRQPVRIAPAPRAVVPRTIAKTSAPLPSEPPPSTAKTKIIRGSKSTFVDAGFDDTGNTSTSRTPSKTVKKAKTTIVTDFEN